MTVLGYNFMLQFYITADHKCHCCLGECDTPTSTKNWRRTCPYCEVDPQQLAHPKKGSSRWNLKEKVKEGALFPNLPMIRRPPDLLHMICNVSKWLLRNTSQVLHPHYTRKMNIKWGNKIIDPYIKKVCLYFFL